MLLRVRVRVFQGPAGEDGGRGEGVSDLSLFDSERTAVAGMCALISVPILRREQWERRASKAPVETEANEDHR